MEDSCINHRQSSSTVDSIDPVVVVSGQGSRIIVNRFWSRFSKPCIRVECGAKIRTIESLEYSIDDLVELRVEELRK